MPDITVTTIPMKTIKARYFINANKLDKALELLNEGIPANPYLFISENLKAQVYLKQGKIDSAFFNARKSFYGLPKNALHASTYAQALQTKRMLMRQKKSLISSVKNQDLQFGKISLLYYHNYFPLEIRIL